MTTQENLDAQSTDMADVSAEDVTVEENTTPDETLVLQARIDELTLQVKEATEAAARANAESYNARNRMEQETEKAKKFALEKFAKSLLDVVDNLERAIEANEKIGTNEQVLEGIRLTHKSLLDVLEKNGVQVVNPIGEKFDPDYHEAVGIAPDTPADVVGTVLQKGYTLHERSIRPAMVLVGG